MNTPTVVIEKQFPTPHCYLRVIRNAKVKIKIVDGQLLIDNYGESTYHFERPFRNYWDKTENEMLNDSSTI